MSTFKVGKTWEDEYDEVDSIRKEKSESKMAKVVAATNHVGKVCKKKRQRPKMPIKPPRNYTRGTTFTNYGASLGMTDDEYRNWKKTGNLPSHLISKKD